MGTLKRVLAPMIMATLALAGCAPHEAGDLPPAPLQQHYESEPFLPAYLAMLRHERPFPVDTCHAVDIRSLLIPCDTP